MVSMLCYPSRTWMVSFKRPGICQNFCFYFKLSWKREEHIAVCANSTKSTMGHAQPLVAVDISSISAEPLRL